MNLKSDKGRTALALLISKVWEDKELESEFKRDPVGVLKKEGIDIPKGTAVKVLQNTDTVKYVPLSQTFDPIKEQDKIASLFALLTPIPEGKEVRLVQSTKETYYILIPVHPPVELRTALKSSQLINMAAASGFEATYHDTTQTLEAETTELVVAETTEAMQVESTVAVVAELAIVLI